MADKYRFVKDTYEGIESYAIYSSSGISQGDQMQWDPVSRVATNDTLASGGIFLGACEERNPLASLGTPSAPLTNGKMRIKASGIHSFVTTNGQTYSHMDALAQGADVQRVTSVLGANRMIARVYLPDGTQVVGDGTNEVPVQIFGSQTQNSIAPSSAAGDR